MRCQWEKPENASEGLISRWTMVLSALTPGVNNQDACLLRRPHCTTSMASLTASMPRQREEGDCPAHKSAPCIIASSMRDTLASDMPNPLAPAALNPAEITLPKKLAPTISPSKPRTRQASCTSMRAVCGMCHVKLTSTSNAVSKATTVATILATQKAPRKVFCAPSQSSRPASMVISLPAAEPMPRSAITR